MAMDITSLEKYRVCFVRFDHDVYAKLQKLCQQSGHRGVASIVRLIVEQALMQGVRVTGESDEDGDQA